MDNLNIWNEICFILSDILYPNMTEQVYELKVIQAFEKLGWSQYRKEISVRENIQLGSANRIYPDLIFKSQPSGKNLFVVEIKKPSADIYDPSFKSQLYSYMRMLKLNFGILIGSKIQLFADKPLINSNGLTLIEEFPLNGVFGIKFVNLLKKDNFDPEKIEEYITKKIELIEALKQEKVIKDEILSDKYLKKIIDFIKEDISKRHQVADLDKLINSLSITLKDSSKQIIPQTKNKFYRRDQNEDFDKKYREKRSSEKITKNGMKIGEFVKNSFRTLYQEKILTDEEIENLQDITYCKMFFKTSKPLFVHKDEGIEGITDNVGIKRYYAHEIFYKDYYLYSQWAERHWKLFLTWLISVGYNVSMEFDSK